MDLGDVDWSEAKDIGMAAPPSELVYGEAFVAADEVVGAGDYRSIQGLIKGNSFV